jgi:hypothetical protein
MSQELPNTKNRTESIYDIQVTGRVILQAIFNAVLDLLRTDGGSEAAAAAAVASSAIRSMWT